VQPNDHIQIVTFRLAGLTHEEFAAHARAAAPALRDMPGLREKAWLADERTNVYGGVYAWESRAAMEAYIDGPIFAGLRANPRIEGVTTHGYEVLEGPTRVTQRRQAHFALAPHDTWAAA
jgi:heme-degrading monooxygenase HmoA